MFSISLSVLAQDGETQILSRNSYDLSGPGRAFLLNEAQRVNFFLLGELHGEREIPELLNSIWPTMYGYGYHHIAAEISEWAATKLEFPQRGDSSQVEGLWTDREARMVRSIAGKKTKKVLWGCDMEEVSLGEMTKEFFQQHSSDKRSSQVLNTIANGYNRKLAPELLALINTSDNNHHDDLFASILVSLKIDSARAFPASRLKAQLIREELMKRSFLKNYNSDSKSKVFFRFGRNHLHYGFDNRGISTLGNFIAEFSISKNLTCFNVAAFAAGGKYALMGKEFDADERADDPAFQFLSERATQGDTVFDLRPLRLYLHTIPSNDRTELQQRLLYWADSYDAIICYKSVTPR